MNYVGVALIVFAALMILQQYVIAWISQNGFEKWDDTARSYGKHRENTYHASLIAVLIAVVLSLAWIFVEPTGWLADQYIWLLKKESLISVFGAGLLATIFRLILDRRIERMDKKGRDNGSIDSTGFKKNGFVRKVFNLLKSNLWLTWFLVSYVLLALFTFYSPQILKFAVTSDQIKIHEAETAVNAAIALLEKDSELNVVPNESDQDGNSITDPIKPAFETLRDIDKKLLAFRDSEPSDEITAEAMNLRDAAMASVDTLNSARTEMLNAKLKKEEGAKTKLQATLGEAKTAYEAAKKDTEANPDDIDKPAVASTKKSEMDKAESNFNAAQKKIAEIKDKLKSPINFKQSDDQKFTLYWNRIPAALVAVALWGILWFSWYRWVFYHIHRLMREHHRFRGPAVNEFMKQSDHQTPRQVVFLGPKHSGKSELVEQISQEPKVPQSTIPVFREQTHRGTLLSLCDMPGENLGDHVAYMSKYRIDWLVIVLRVGAFLNTNGEIFDEENLPIEFEDLLSLPNVCSDAPRIEIDENNEEQNFYDGKYTQEYFTALRLVLKQSGNEENSSIFENVKNLLLILNYNAADQAEVNVATNVIGDESLGRLTSSISQNVTQAPLNSKHLVLSVIGGATQVLNILVPEQSEAESLSLFRRLKKSWKKYVKK